ncbi:MAG: ABC transporter permease subunit [Pseudomonadota bacterium]
MISESAKGIGIGIGFVALLIGLWELLGARGGVALTAVLPPPSQFLGTIAESGFKIGLGAQAAPVWDSALSTLGRVFAGMAVAFVLAILTGALLSLSKVATWCLRPVLHILAPIAPIAWIPTAIVVFGISNMTAVFIVFMGVYFVLTIATLAEIERVPAEYLTVAENLGASPAERWVSVVVPAILPGIFMLLRTNFLAAWMAVLVAEMVGLRDGLGAIIMMGRNLFNNELIMFGMVIIGVTGFLVDKVLALIGARLLWWRS